MPVNEQDGLFGNYFLRMVHPCGTQTQVVTGFKKNPFGKIICTDITAILAKIPTTEKIVVGDLTNVIKSKNSKINIDGIASADTPSVNGTAEWRNLVTVEYLDEILKKRVPRIEIGTYKSNKHGDNRINFQKSFQKTPLVIAQPVGMWYNDKCRQDNWDFNTIPKNIDKNGFSVYMPNTHRCGGDMHNHSVSYVAIENVENLISFNKPIHIPHITIPRTDEDINKMERMQSEINVLKNELQELKDQISRLQNKESSHKTVINNSNTTVQNNSSSTIKYLFSSVPEYVYLSSRWRWFEVQTNNKKYSGTLSVTTTQWIFEVTVHNGRWYFTTIFRWSSLICDDEVIDRVLSVRDSNNNFVPFNSDTLTVVWKCHGKNQR